MVVAVLMVGFLWLRARVGLDLTSDRIAWGVWIAVGILTFVTFWGLVSLTRGEDCLDDAGFSAAAGARDGLAPARRRAGLSVRLRPGASRPSAGATPPRARHTNCGRLAFRRCSERVFSSRWSRCSRPCREHSCSSCWCRGRPGALDQRAAGGSRPASCRTVVGARRPFNRADWRRGAAVGACRAPGAERCRAAVATVVDRRRPVGAVRFSAYEVRHAVARHRCRRCRDDSCHVCQRRAGGLAGARVCDRHHCDAWVEDRRSCPAATPAPSNQAVPGTVEPAPRRPRHSIGTPGAPRCWSVRGR